MQPVKLISTERSDVIRQGIRSCKALWKLNMVERIGQSSTGLSCSGSKPQSVGISSDLGEKRRTRGCRGKRLTIKVRPGIIFGCGNRRSSRVSSSTEARITYSSIRRGYRQVRSTLVAAKFGRERSHAKRCVAEAVPEKYRMI